MILDGYWDKRPSEEMKARILADWADTLEDWTQEQVLYGLRKWRDENPNKKPNPGHILSILKAIRGEREMKRLRARQEPQQAPKGDRVTPEAAAAIMEEKGFSPAGFAPKRMEEE